MTETLGDSNPMEPELSPPERGEQEKESQSIVKIYLGRHPDKPIRAKVSDEEVVEYKEKNPEDKSSDDAIYHRLRHDKGGAPLTPDDEVTNLSLEGIYQAQNYARDILSKVIEEAPDNSVILDFAVSDLPRTKESAEIMRHELETNAKKQGKNIKILGITEIKELAVRDWDFDYLSKINEDMQKYLENPPGEEFAPDPNKTASEINDWIKGIKELAKTFPQDKKYIAVGISHGGILDAYLKKETGKMPKDLDGDIKKNEFMKIEEFKNGNSKLEYRGKEYNLNDES